MKDQLYTFSQLLMHDLIVFKRDFCNKFIDLCFVISTSLIVLGYLLPFEGLDGYGVFILIGIVASVGYFEIIGRVNQLVADVEGGQSILYFLTLPLKSALVICYFPISWALQTALLSLLVLPIGKLIVFKQFNVGSISIIKFLMIFIVTNLFFGFLSLFLASVLKQLKDISRVWVRILGPMYFFGCYVYPWSKAYSLSKVFAYISLINPYVYIMEGMRAAALGQKDFLPFWNCLGVLIIFTFFLALAGVKIMQKRLDSV